MDVNLALSRIRGSVKTVRREQDGTDPKMTERQLRNVLAGLVEEVEALDKWLSDCGRLPADWEVVDE